MTLSLHDLTGARGPKRSTVSVTPLLVAQLAVVCRGLVVDTEYRFHPTRRWRFDVAIVGYKLAIEVEGGVYVHGRHSRGQGLEADCEKYAEAMALGWTVLRVTPRQVKSGQALDWIERLLTKGPRTHEQA